MTASKLSEPILEMNTTPLIDVMLVLLIMLIVTIPLQSHAVKLDLPSSKPRFAPDPVRNVVEVSSDGAYSWNARPVAKSELAPLLEATMAMPVIPELHIRPSAEAPYLAVDELLVLTKRADVTRVGFVGNEAYGKF